MKLHAQNIVVALNDDSHVGVCFDGKKNRKEKKGAKR